MAVRGGQNMGQDMKQDSAEILECVRRRCDEWIASLKSPNIDKIYSSIKSGKMLRSKLILAILESSKVDFAKDFRGDSKVSFKDDSKEDSKKTNSKKVNSKADSTQGLSKDSSILDCAISLCAIIELIQCASLLHDDVIDEAHTRRGVPSVNASFGDKNAIMLGDVLYSRAYFYLADFPQAIAKSVSNAVCALSRGEIDDVLYSRDFQPSLEVYYKILEDKTASLIASSAESSAILAGLDSAKYYEYGKNLGLAFQIVDDVLDITQDEATLGKPNMNDLREGKSTLPYILLYCELDSHKKEEFLAHFYARDSVAIEWFRNAFCEQNTIQKCQNIAKDFITKALNAIQDERNSTLEQIATSMIERSF